MKRSEDIAFADLSQSKVGSLIVNLIREMLSRLVIWFKTTRRLRSESASFSFEN